MKGTIVKIYLGFLALCLFLLGYAILDFRNDVSLRTTKRGCEVLTKYTYTKYEAPDEPVGVREEYLFEPLDIADGYRKLMIYTIHQNVEVYVGDTRVYYMRPFFYNAFGSTPGCVWNQITLTDEDLGEPIRVNVYPVYKQVVGVTPMFYFGDASSIYAAVVKKQTPAVFLCLCAMLAGVLFIASCIYNYKNPELDKSILMLGVFAVMISLWKLSDSDVAYLLFPGLPSLYILPYLTLHLTSIPFILFIKELHTDKNRKTWYIPVFFSLFVFTVSMLLQITNLLDFRQTLPLLHAELVLTAVFAIGMSVREVIVTGFNPRLRRNTLLLLLCVLGLIADLVMYYVSNALDGTVFGMLAFVIYICAIGAYTLREAQALMAIGVKARTFEKKAYQDTLTGLENRTAYVDYTSGEGFSPEGCIVIVLDLNNLKKCNDTLGHEKGDLYIKECAGIIRNTFGDIGHCYRMGGDEFCVLLKNVSLDTCKKRVRKMQDAVAERNRLYPEMDMGIACGYELYDRRIDYSIGDVSRRADKMMYREKYSMKQLKAAQGN